MSSHNRDRVLQFHTALTKIPGVLTAFHVVEARTTTWCMWRSQAQKNCATWSSTTSTSTGESGTTETQLVFSVLPGSQGVPFETRATRRYASSMHHRPCGCVTA